MNVAIRFLLLVNNLILLLFAGVLIAAALGEINLKYYLTVLATTQNRFIMGLCGVIVCLLALIGIVKALSRTSNKISSVTINDSGIGSIGVTIPAVKAMIMMAVKTVSGVRDVNTKINNSPDGLIIDLHMMINPDQKVPDMSSEIQNAIKNHLEEIGGLKIAAVRVLVDDFSPSEKANRT